MSSEDPNMAYQAAGDDDGDMKIPLMQNTDPQQKRSGICAPCQWFKEKPLSRWQFALLLLFGLLTPLWALLRAMGSSLTGDILSGAGALFLALYGANHFRILLGLKEQVDKYARNNKAMKEENVQIKREVSKLSKASEELSAVSKQLKETTKGYQSNIGKFKALDEKLSKLADDNIAGLEKLQEMTKTVQDSIKDELVQHQRDIVFRVQESMEFGDDQEGMSKAEYDRFVKALPAAYQALFNEKDFNEMAGDDGNMDLKEFTIMIDAMCVEQANKQH